MGTCGVPSPLATPLASFILGLMSDGASSDSGLLTADSAGGFTTLRKRADFLAANSGLRVARPGFVVLARPNGGRGKRIGYTVTKRIGNAVVRNRMKRRMRALARELLPAEGLPDHDHVLIGREGGIERDFATLRTELSAALQRLREGKGDRARAPRPRGRGRR